MSSMRHDLRYAIRTIAKTPGFAIVAIASLALGIGANTAIFSLLNGIRLSALPVPQPDQLVILTDPSDSGLDIGFDTGDRTLLTYPEFVQIQQQATSFSGLMASQSSLARIQARVNGSEPEELQARMVSPEYFATLGVTAGLGRTFDPVETRVEGAAPYAVISHAYWQRRLGGRPDALGATLTINGGVFSIVGVTPASFFGETVGQRPDAWLPLSMQATVAPGRDWLRDRPGTIDKVMWLHVFGRLKPDVSIDTARAEVNAIFTQGLSAYYGRTGLTRAQQRPYLDQRLNVQPAATGASRARGQFSGPLVLLLTAAAMVLLIACANLANLLLARATARTREVAVRRALGVSRARLIQGFLIESLLLAVLGGIAGLFAASLIRSGLLLLVPDTIHLPPSADARVLGFAFAVTVIVGLALGLLPALRSAHVDFVAGLKEQGRGLAGSVTWQRVSKLVVVGQLALSLPLLVVAGLLVQTMANLRRVDLGYARERLITVRVNVETAGYDAARRLPLVDRLLERIGSVPGVRAVSYARNGLFSGSSSGGEVIVEGYTPRGNNDAGATWDYVGPNYLSTLGIHVVLGREITAQDHPSSQRVCVINEAFARKFFPQRHPIGMRIGSENACQIVGVVRDFRARTLRGDITPQFYVSASQAPSMLRDLRFAIRTAGEASAAIADVRRAVLQVDANLPVTARVFTDVVDAEMVQDRLLARLSIAFGIVGLVLAAIGVYGVLSFGVSRRIYEIGIRKALGAQHHDVTGMILRETGMLLAIGLIAGLALAAAGARFMTSRLYGLESSDPATFALAIAMLAGVSLFAAWLPSHRASRIDPLVALRRD